MTRRDRIAEALPNGCALEVAHHNGAPAWAAVCDDGSPRHRVTLSGGVACWKWWRTLLAAETDLRIKEATVNHYLVSICGSLQGFACGKETGRVEVATAELAGETTGICDDCYEQWGAHMDEEDAA